MLVSYITISIRYFKRRWLEGLVNLATASMAMIFLLIALAIYLHGMPVLPSVAFFLCATGILFLLGISIENRQHRNHGKEIEIRYVFGAGVVDIYLQVYVETLLLTALGGLVSIALLDIIMSGAPLTEQIIGRQYLFHPSTLFAFLLFIPAITLLISIYPTLNLRWEKHRPR